MKLSIIVLNYNTAQITLDCLNSIEKHPLDLENYKFEVLLVDNASSDNSAKLLKNFKTKKFKYKFIQNKSNLGFPKGNNVGIKKSKGEYKLLLNSDTKLTKNALNRLIKTAEADENIGVVGAKLLNEDGSTQASVFNLPNVNRTAKQYLFGKKLLEKYYPKSKQPTEVESVVAAAMLITPTALKKVGLLNEKYFMYFEDLDYCREINKAGLKIIYEPRAEIYHLHGASGDSNWKRLIPSSKIYHGNIRHYLIFLITWIGSKIGRN